MEDSAWAAVAREAEARRTMAAGKSLAQLNTEAVAAARAGQHVTAVATWTLLFEAASSRGLAHPGMHTARLNRSSSLLKLGLHTPAREDADVAIALLVAAMPGCHTDLLKRSPPPEAHPGPSQAL
ncbi:hypothetical protein FOA52_005029 [Chlamydomonas sp. UWO 241]|nr:hypothetical protein FOA52_005029 [Chlamydomonas sp. UWO 241]